MKKTASPGVRLPFNITDTPSASCALVLCQPVSMKRNVSRKCERAQVNMLETPGLHHSALNLPQIKQPLARCKWSRVMKASGGCRLRQTCASASSSSLALPLTEPLVPQTLALGPSMSWDWPSCEPFLPSSMLPFNVSAFAWEPIPPFRCAPFTMRFKQISHLTELHTMLYV